MLEKKFSRDVVVRSKQIAGLLVLPLIVTMAGALRFSNLDWDGLLNTHPDERYILFVADSLGWPDSAADLLRPAVSTLNPFREPSGVTRSYPYGHLPLYVMVIVDALGGEVLVPAYDEPFERLTIVGRGLSALYDTLTVLVVGLLGRRLWGRQAGWLAAGFTALAVMHIQQAHFATVDTALTLLVMLALWSMVRVAGQATSVGSVLSGLLVGLAAGSKAPGALLVVPLIVVYVRRDDENGMRIDTNLWMALLAMALAFAITNPYAVLQAGLYLRDISTQSALVRGQLDWTFARQFNGTLPVWYYLQQQARWGLGLPLTVVGYAGLGWGTLRARQRGEKQYGPLLIWTWLFLLVVGTQFVKFARYMLPLTPVLFLMAGGMLSAMKKVGAALAAVSLLATALFALAFVRIYSQPHPWLEASRWMYANLEEGSVLVIEQGDDGLPFDVDVMRADDYFERRQIDAFVPAGDRDALADLLSEVAAADYVVISSQRLYGTVPYLEQRYPQGAAYYRALFGGELGFSLERAFSRYPNVLGVALVDDSFSRAGLSAPRGLEEWLPEVRWQRAYADESLTVYDHPLALIFRNDGRLSADRMEEIILSAQ